MIAVDTNIWIYAVDHRDPKKRKCAMDLIENLAHSDEARTIWQVASEFVNCLTRWENKGEVTADKVDFWLEWMIEMFPLITPQRLTVVTALDLRRRHCLSHWDSMLLAACIEAEVTTLYSEDLSHNTRYESVQVVNPFV